MFLFRDITDDEAFVDELRVTLRFFAAVLVRRTQKVTNETLWQSLKPRDPDWLNVSCLNFSPSLSGGCGVPHHAKAPQSFHEAHWNNQQGETERYRSHSVFSFACTIKKPVNEPLCSLLIFCSEELRVSSTSCPGGVRSGPPRGPSQSQRRAPLPEEADGDALPLYPATQGYRLQVTQSFF